jgi:rhamnosyl/mannosyltransferase
VIPFGIDLEPFLGIQPRHGSSLPLILAVGRLTYYKGFHHLVEAMQGLRAQLVIIGEGEQRGFLETQIAGLGLADRVTLAGRLDTPQLLDWYARASLFCLPSCHASEAFGLVMVEAMASGLPVVSTDLPTGVRAVNAHGETGFVVKAGDAGALRQALRQLIADADLRRRMGLEGRQRAIDLFSRERMGEQILKLYDAVLRQPAPAVLPLTDGEEVSA